MEKSSSIQKRYFTVEVKVKITQSTSCSIHFGAMLYVIVGDRVCLAMGHDAFWLASF